MQKRPPWTDKYKQNWDDAYQRIMAWWHGEPLDRPVLLNAGRRAELPADIAERRHALRNIALRDPRRFDLDAELQLEQVRLFVASHHFCAEAAPFARTGYAASLGLLAVAAGGAIQYTPETGTSWSVEDPAFLERPLPAFCVCPGDDRPLSPGVRVRHCSGRQPPDGPFDNAVHAVGQ